MKVLITGAAGFIGGYLVEGCRQAGEQVLGIDVREPRGTWGTAEFEACDVRNGARLTALISSFQPDRIFHLAAQSRPTVSLLQPRETMETNVRGTVNLLEALRAHGVMATVVVACSSAEYGPVDERDLPVRETHPLNPLHPYGVSKVAQDLLAEQYFLHYGIPVVRLRIFNTTGPGAVGDVCSDLTRRAVEIERGQQSSSSMAVGNLASRRAFVDVRDLVEALRMSAERCKAGEVYNLGADQTYSIEEIANEVGAILGIRFQLQQQPALMRRLDERVVQGDNWKFRSHCTWAPKIPLATTLGDMLEWWRVRLGAPYAAVC